MTVTEKAMRKRITGVIPFTLNPLQHNVYLESASHLKVYADDVLLVNGLDYSVSSLLTEAGYEVDITIPTPGLEPAWWAPDYFILVVEPPIEQGHDTSLGGTYGARFEDALDALARRVQTIYDMAQRSIKLSLSSVVGTEYDLPPAEAGKIFGWNDDATALVLYDDPTDSAADAVAAAAAADASADAADASADAAASSAAAASGSASAADASADAAAASVAAIGTSVADAAASAAAAAVAETAAELAETNAETAEVAAELAETNAEAAQAAAAASASAASTSASNAATSASAAATAKTAAELAETNAETAEVAAELAETNAEAAEVAAEAAQAAAAVSETNAAASALTARVAAAAFAYTFSTTTADADPGAGVMRLNNADPALATAAYIDNSDADAVAVSALIDEWDDSTNTIKGTLTLRDRANAATRRTYNVTGSVVDGTGYRKVTLVYVGGAGALANAANLLLVFDRTGDKGANGAGAGDVVGPASVTDDLPAIFDGTTGKLIKQKTYAAFKTLLALVKGDVGLGNVDNTSDASKPVSTATQAALDLKANLAGPTFTGAPSAPTAAPGTNTTQLSTTAFVKAAIDVVLGGVAAAFDTLSEIANELALKATIASPTFTGTPAAPTAAGGTNTTQIATTAFAKAEAAALLSTADQTITGGARVTTLDLGNLTGATITPDPGDRPIQKITNNGAGTIAPGANQGAYLLVVKNTTGAGAITTSGWQDVSGEAFDTTTTSEFLCHCTVVGDFTAMVINKVA